MLAETFIVTDIDGTLVPHPYHSGLSQEERNPYVQRLVELISRDHVACVTGRSMWGWRRLLEDAGEKPGLPRLAGLEFGADVYFKGNQVPQKKSSGEIALVVSELKEELSQHAEFRSQTEVGQIMSAGKLNGYFIEEKNQMVQIDWSFATEGLNLKFAELVFSVVNPHLAHNQALKTQVFHQRIDLLENDFVPKASLSQHLREWVNDVSPQSSVAHRRCLAFGDELYDDYLFKSLKALQGELFAEVLTFGVGHAADRPLRHADETLPDPAAAWSLLSDRLGS